MKYSLLFLGFIVVSSLRLSAAASPVSSSDVFWQAVRSLVSQCAVQPVRYTERGVKILGNLQVRCEDIVILGKVAVFKLDQTTYIATLSASTDSDGGDLGNLEVRDAEGSWVVRKANIAAEGDVLVALAGGVQDLNIEEITGMSLQVAFDRRFSRDP